MAAAAGRGPRCRYRCLSQPAPALVERPDIKNQGAALRAVYQDQQFADLPPASILQFASALKEAGEPAAASVLESAAQLYPDDVWINYTLAEVLADIPARRDEALRYYTAARALRPESAHNLGHLLDRMGRTSDAIATFRALIKLRPTEARNIGCLSTILLDHQRREEGLKTLDQAIAAARETIEREPGDAGEAHILGYLLAAKGDVDGAIAAYRVALGIDPSHTGALTNLATILRNRGDQDGVIAILRTAIRAKPDYTLSHEAPRAAALLAKRRHRRRHHRDPRGHSAQSRRTDIPHATRSFAQTAEELDDSSP